MARYFKNPNPHSQVLDQNYSHRLLIIVFVLLALAAAIWYTQTKSWFTAIIGLGFGSVLILLSQTMFRGMGKNDRGEAAEIQVQKTLGNLPDTFVVFQNVPIKKIGDIDLIVVGPPGVYTIEVKSHHRFNNTKEHGKDFVGQALREALSLKEYFVSLGLDIYVNAMLVFPQAFVKTKVIRGVTVTNKKFMLESLRRAQPVRFNQIYVEDFIKRLYNS